MPDERDFPPRRDVKAALRGLGLSVRQVDALLRDGWKALVGETRAEADELREALGALTKKLTK